MTSCFPIWMPVSVWHLVVRLLPQLTNTFKMFSIRLTKELHGIFQMYMMQPVPTLRMFILSPPRIYMGQKKQLWLVMIIAVSYMLQLIFRMVLGIDYIIMV